jgi:hypothetical protein
MQYIHPARDGHADWSLTPVVDGRPLHAGALVSAIVRPRAIPIYAVLLSKIISVRWASLGVEGATPRAPSAESAEAGGGPGHRAARTTPRSTSSARAAGAGGAPSPCRCTRGRTSRCPSTA